MAQVKESKVEHVNIDENGKLVIRINELHVRVNLDIVARNSKVIRTMIEAENLDDEVELDFQDDKEYCTLLGMLEVMKMIHSPKWNPYRINAGDLFDAIKFAFKYDFSCIKELEAQIIQVPRLINRISSLELADVCNLKNLKAISMGRICRGNIIDEIKFPVVSKPVLEELVVTLLKRVKVTRDLISTMKPQNSPAEAAKSNKLIAIIE
jgi:hypothetical protein